MKTQGVINVDHRRTIDKVAELTGVPWSTFERILSRNLEITKRVAAKCVPRLSTNVEQLNRETVCLELKNYLKYFSISPTLLSNLPDLVQCDFFLSLRMKIAVKGKRFSDVEKIKKKRPKH